MNLSITERTPASRFIAIITDSNIDPLNKEETKDEAYILNITASSINISVRTSAGAFYAYQTLYSLRGSNNVFPIGIVKDQPRFAYRGMHVDVGRNFHTKEEILKILDAMAMYKLNKFHFHLTEDEGWRMEIPGLPELTEVVLLFNKLIYILHRLYAFLMIDAWYVLLYDKKNLTLS